MIILEHALVLTISGEECLIRVQDAALLEVRIEMAGQVFRVNDVAEMSTE